MSTDTSEYTVYIEEFAKRHYIKVFFKKHNKAWTVTENAILEMLIRFDEVVGMTDKIDVIMSNCDKLIAKLDFKIAGTRDSAKSSGNRAIIYVDKELLICRVLLVYSKNQISSPNETQKCKTMIKSNYPEIWASLSKKLIVYCSDNHDW